MQRRLEDPKPKKNQIHILIIEDDNELRTFLSSELTLRGYHTQTAADGLEAMEKVRRHPFNLVLSDLRMPRMDGMAVLKALKEIDPQIDVILMSGQGDIEIAVKAIKLGAFDFLEKPVSMEKLLLLIDKALEKSEIRMLMALYSASRMLFSSSRLEELLSMTMNMLYSVFKADEGSFMIYEEERLRILTSRGIPEEIVKTASVKMGERVSGYALQHKKPLLLIEGREKYSELGKIETRTHIQSSMVIPVYCNDTPVGVLNLSRTVHRENFTYNDLRNATIFASQLGQTVHNSRLGHSLDEKMKELKEAYRLLEERKALLEEKEKLAKVGCMIAGMVHEVNNPLTAVLGHADLLLSQDDLAPEVRETLQIILRQAMACRDLVQDLLLYSRRRKPELRDVDLPGLIHDVLNCASPEILRSGVRVRFCYPKNFQTVQADPQQLAQVFLNLVKNSCQALETRPGKRHLAIKIRPNADAASADILVMDNGSGIPADLSEKIFDPFFTTKPSGKGTGLGLSMVREIVREHGGRIDVRPSHLPGAVFSITLPYTQTTLSGLPSRA